MRPTRAIFATLLAAAAGLVPLAGCSFFTGEPKKHPPPIEFTLQTPYPEVRTFAIAPAINLSGSRDFDPLVVSDTLFAEMQQVEGLNVLPLNKTLIVMQKIGIHSLENAHDVQVLAEAMGADGVVVPAVTAYDPYNPPTVGMVLQLYTPRPHEVVPAAKVETPKASRANSGGPTTVSNIAVDLAVEAAPPAPPKPFEADRQPASQVSAVFNASNQTVLKELQVFSEGRTQYDSALQDKKFLVESDAYMRFVAHAMVRRLMDVERTRLSDR